MTFANAARPTKTEAPRPGLLIVDDDPLIADSLSFLLEADFLVTSRASRGAAIAWLREQPAAPKLALIDLGLPPCPHRPDEGYALIADLLAHAPDTRIVVLSGQGEEGLARHARALGATEFVSKPAQPAALHALLRQLAETCSPPPPALPALIGNSEPVIRLRAQIVQYADLPYPVLVEGESGTGKDIVANCLHAGTTRGGQPFLALNCAAISPSLVEPTLFGHARGAFTGAQTARAGYFEEAASGSLFLDEIGELPLSMQSKLLRAIQERSVRPVGSTAEVPVNARILSATHRDLAAEVQAGRFRQDLYYRINVIQIRIPPLRERLEDLDDIADAVLARLAREAGIDTPMHLSDSARARLRQHDFPGNVRELENLLLRAVALAGGDTIEAGDLALPQAEPAAEPPSWSDATPLPGAPILAEGDAPLPADLAAHLDAVERSILVRALEVHRNNRTAAGQALGLSLRQMRYRMARLGIQPGDGERAEP